MGPSKDTHKFTVREMVFPVAVMACIWLMLTGWDPLSWYFGAAAIVLGLVVLCFLRKTPAFLIYPRGIIPFMGTFTRQSVMGGIDVAWRALNPRYTIAPRVMTYNFRLKNEIARACMANVISLLPGTLSLELQEGSVLVHLLDEKFSDIKELRILEKRIAALFGERMDDV